MHTCEYDECLPTDTYLHYNVYTQEESYLFGASGSNPTAAYYCKAVGGILGNYFARLEAFEMQFVFLHRDGYTAC